MEPDGATRIVQYTADPHNGFQAVVKRIENHYHAPQYTQGHALYGAHYPGLFNEQTVPQFGHPEENVHLAPEQHQLIEHVPAINAEIAIPTVPVNQPHYVGQTDEETQPKLPLPITVYQSKLLDVQSRQNDEPQLHPEQYYLSQYAGNYGSNTEDEPAINHEDSRNVQLANPEIANTYSTLHYQPEYVEIKQESLPQHIVKNILDQYNGGHGEERGSLLLQPRGFSLPHANVPKGYEQEPQVHVTPKQNVVYVTSTPTPNVNVESSTVAAIPYSTTENYYVQSTTPSPIQNEYHEHDVQPNVQVSPNGENLIKHEDETAQHREIVDTEKNLALNPILMNLMLYIKDHMPPVYKDRFETVMKPYFPVPTTPKSIPVVNNEVIVSTTASPPVAVTQNYAHNPFLNGEFQASTLRSHPQEEYVNQAISYEQQLPQQEYRGDNNYNDQNSRKIYYELDPAAYQQHAQSKAADTVFQVVNENGYDLKTPNFYKPTDPNMYNGYHQVYQNAYPEIQYRANIDNVPSGTDNDFIYNAGDYTAPREPEVLVRQLNATCAYFRFNQTNDFEERDQDPHIWNSGDYTALRAEEELIRSVNITCDNFTKDALNNFTSGISLRQYCSQCLYGNVDRDVNILNKEVISNEDGRQVELYYNANNQEGTSGNVYRNTYVPQEQRSYEDNRSNAEIAGLIPEYQISTAKPSIEYNSEANLNPNILALIKRLNLAQSQSVPKQEIYVENVGNSGLYKRTVKRDKV